MFCAVFFSPRFLLFFFRVFSTVIRKTISYSFFFYRGTRRMMKTTPRTTTKGCGSPVLTGGRRMVSYDGRMLTWLQVYGTTLVSTLMERSMDITSCMILLVMCCGNRTGYWVRSSRVPPTPHPPDSAGVGRQGGLHGTQWHVCSMRRVAQSYLVFDATRSCGFFRCAICAPCLFHFISKYVNKF